MARRRPDRGPARAPGTIALVTLALAGCATTIARYRRLPEVDRDAYETCAMQRCGPAPQWKGEASWAVRAYEQESAAHVACWDRDLDAYVAIEGSEPRRLWLLGRCQRELTAPPPPPLPMPRT